MAIQLERQGARSEAYSRRLPTVTGGVCDFCGIIDKNAEATDQYKLCPHYRGTQLRCTYCPGTKDPNEVIRISKFNVAENPDRRDEWIAWCDSYECSKKHEERFKRSN